MMPRRLRRPARSKRLFAGVALAGLLLAPLLIRFSDDLDTEELERRALPDDQFIEIGGLRLRVRVAGSGRPTFVLLHGFVANLECWNDVIEPLTRLGMVIAYDRPGFGLTSWTAPEERSQPGPCATERQPEIAVAILDQFNVDRAVLIGHSLGAVTALLTALRYPDRVERLILVGPYVGRLPSLLSAPARRLLRTPHLQRPGALVIDQIARNSDRILRRTWHDPSRISPEVYRRYRPPIEIRGWQRAYWHYLYSPHGTDLQQRLSQLQVPTLVITGEHDRLASRRSVRRLLTRLPDARLQVIPNCGHIPQEECPEEFMAAVRQFVTS